MSACDEVGRRGFLAGILGGLGATALIERASAESPPLPPGVGPQSPLALAWDHRVHEIVATDLKKFAPQLADPGMKERHQVYAGLVAALIRRFWNGNNMGPAGRYPWRESQKEVEISASPSAFRYHGDRAPHPDTNIINWDRYLGHNIACLAVDGRGEVIDFDFNHNNLFHSSVEHAEARIVRRVFSLTNVFDTWRTGKRIPGKSASFSLRDVTIYTSLESCAQCSGIMALGRVKQVVYLQSDPGQFRVGNIMFNLAGSDKAGDPLAALPIPGSASGIDWMGKLDAAYAAFAAVQAAQGRDGGRPYFIPSSGGAPVYDTSITSFLCTDSAFEIFSSAADAFSGMAAGDYQPDAQAMTNAQALHHAREFFQYADVEGYRGSPHKL